MSFDLNKFKQEILLAVSQLLDARLGSVQQGQPVQAAQPEVKQEKPEEIRAVFYRYVRPLYEAPNGTIHFHPTKGLTLRFELDYVGRYALVSYSICNGDLFSKQAGREAADNTRQTRSIAFPLPKQGFDADGIVSHFMDVIRAHRDEADVQRGCVDRMLRQYRESQFLF